MASGSRETDVLRLSQRPEVPPLDAATPDFQNKSHWSHYGGRIHEGGSHQPCDGENTQINKAIGVIIICVLHKLK